MISRNEYPISVVRAGCDARRDECRLASHTNEEQRSSAPGRAAKMGYSFLEITLRLEHADHLREAFDLALHALSCGCRLFNQSGILLGSFIHLVDGLIDLLDT